MQQSPKKTRAGFIRHRYVVCALVCSGLSLVYAMRVNLGVAVIAMAGTSAKNRTFTNTCIDEAQYEHEPHRAGEFQWSDSFRSTLLGAFFYGYISTQIAGGILADKFSIKWVFGYGIFLTSVLTLVTHWVARWNDYAFLLLRVLEGITEGVTTPSMYCLLARWAPKSERTTMATLCSLGNFIGTIVTLPITAALCESSLGWEASFYLPGIAGVLWSGIWYICVTSQPENHRWISDEERDYIVKHRGNAHVSKKDVHIPWGKILTSPAVWSLAIARVMSHLIFYMFLTEMPSFVDEVFGTSLTKNGELNALFYILLASSTVAAGALSDRLIKKGFTSRTNIRKMFQCTQSLLCGGLFLFASQLGCDYEAVIATLCVTAIANGLIGGGDISMALDLAPGLAGSVMGVVNMFASFSAIIATQIINFTHDRHNIKRGWSNAFIVTAIVSFVGAVFFGLFGTAEEQPWGVRNNTTDDDDECTTKKDPSEGLKSLNQIVTVSVKDNEMTIQI